MYIYTILYIDTIVYTHVYLYMQLCNYMHTYIFTHIDNMKTGFSNNFEHPVMYVETNGITGHRFRARGQTSSYIKVYYTDAYRKDIQ